MVEEIFILRIDNLKLRSANDHDVAIFFEWINDVDVRQQSFNSELVLWKNHRHWYQQKLLDKNCLMFVLEVDDQPVGQIRFDIDDGVAHIDYSLDKKVRGRHWGKVLVSEGINQICNTKNLKFQAEVKQQNIASAKVFINMGFEEKDINNPEVRVFQFSSIK